MVTASQFPLYLWAATDDADVIIGECQKRTGLSESGCIGFVKKYMNVERCQQYTNFSAQECEQKIAALKNDPRFQSESATKKAPVEQKVPATSDRPNQEASNQRRAITLRDRILEAKREKEQRFDLIRDETKAVIAYLQQQGKDTVALEEALREFDVKKQATLLAYDRYQSIAESLDTDEPFILSGPRETVLFVLRDAIDYYRKNLLIVLRQAVIE